MAWTTTELLASIKRRTGMPAASAAYTDTEILTLADEELRAYVVPFILRQREEYFLWHDEQPITDDVYTYPIPSRAIGGKLREVVLLDSNRNPKNVPRLDPGDLTSQQFGFYVDGDAITFVTSETVASWTYYETLRLSYYLRPSQLVATTAVAPVASINTGAGTVTLTSPPGAFTGHTTWDVVSATPHFTRRAADEPGTLSGATLAFTGGVPSNVAVGDWVCLPDQTPVPNIPAELHGMLAQKAANRILSDKQLFDKLKAGEVELERLERDLVSIIAPRVDGEAPRLVARNSLYRLMN